MANEFRRAYTPYEEPEDEDGLFTKIGRMLKGSREYRTTPGMREVDFSGMSARDRAAKARKRERKTPLRMGSDRNVSAGQGRGTVEMPARTSGGPRVAPRRTTGMDPITQSQMYDFVPRPGDTVQYDDGILNPSEFGPATMGPAARPGPVMGSMENVDVDRIGRGGFEATPAQMRRGLFGEEIPEDVYQEMERKNREAGFYGRFKKGGKVKKTKKYASGGSVSSASKRGDGCAQRGKTKGRMV